MRDDPKVKQAVQSLDAHMERSREGWEKLVEFAKREPKAPDSGLSVAIRLPRSRENA